MPSWDHDDLVSKPWPPLRGAARENGGNMPRDKRSGDLEQWSIHETLAPAAKKTQAHLGPPGVEASSAMGPMNMTQRTRAQIGLAKYLDRAYQRLSRLERELGGCASLHTLCLEVEAALQDVRDAQEYVDDVAEENKP